MKLVKKYDRNEMKQPNALMYIMGDNLEIEELISSVTDWLVDLIVNDKLKT